MKKYVFAVLLASLLLLCACQPTPDEPVVLQKDQDLMIEKGSATLPPEESYTPPEVPKRYRFDYRDGALTIHADAEIVVPSEPMPIVNVRAQGIPQKTMYRLFSLLSNGEELDMQRQMTKAEFADLIKTYSEQMDAGPEAWDDMTQEEYQAGLRRKIERLEEAYKAAPETEERRIADGTFAETYVPWSKTTCKTVVAQNQNRWFAVYSYENGNWDSQFQYDRLPLFSIHDVVPLDDTVPLPNGLTVSGAKAYVQELLDTIGEPFAISQVYRVADSADESGDDSLKKGVGYALCFDCIRTVNNVPLALSTSDMGSADERSYSIPWTQEKLRIVVDVDGIVSVKWIGPLTVLDTVSEATTLMPFEKIRGIAEKMIPIVYHPSGWVEMKSLDVEVRSVRLELIRIREQNNVGELKGVLVPVWAFYGTLTAETEFEPIMYLEYGIGGGSPIYEGDKMLLCINAIDGTIIDPLLGY